MAVVLVVVGPLVGGSIKMIFQIRRWVRHITAMPWVTQRLFSLEVLKEIEATVAHVENQHAGEIRFVVENALDITELWHGLSARERAIQVFSSLRIWDTALNNGVLIYILMADRQVEIIADRGIAARVSEVEWRAICLEAECNYRAGRFREGACNSVVGVGSLLGQHFPSQGADQNEQPNHPVLL